MVIIAPGAPSFVTLVHKSQKYCKYAITFPEVCAAHNIYRSFFNPRQENQSVLS